MDVRTRIHVLGLQAEAGEGDLLRLFSRFGTVKSARMVTDLRGNSLGMALVEMSHDSEVKEILKTKNSLLILGKRLMVWQPAAAVAEKFQVYPTSPLTMDKVGKTLSETQDVANFGKAATVFHKALKGSVDMTHIQFQFITTQLYALKVALAAHQSKHHSI